jgi:hypothetical protein
LAISFASILLSSKSFSFDRIDLMSKNTHYLAVEHHRVAKLRKSSDEHSSSEDEWKKLTETDLDHSLLRIPVCSHTFKYIHVDANDILKQFCHDCSWTNIIDPKEKCLLCDKLVSDCSCHDTFKFPLLGSDKMTKIEYLSKLVRHYCADQEVKDLIKEIQTEKSMTENSSQTL